MAIPLTALWLAPPVNLWGRAGRRIVMTRRSMIVYSYHPVPDQLPASTRKTGFIDSLDASIEGFWTPEIKELMQPIGHPQSKRFFIKLYKAAQLIKEGAEASRRHGLHC